MQARKFKYLTAFQFCPNPKRILRSEKPFSKAFVLHQFPEVYRVYPRSSFGEYIFQNCIALQSPLCKMSEVVSGDFIKVSLDLIGQLSIGIAGRLQYFAQGYTS